MRARHWVGAIVWAFRNGSGLKFLCSQFRKDANRDLSTAVLVPSVFSLGFRSTASVSLGLLHTFQAEQGDNGYQTHELTGSRPQPWAFWILVLENIINTSISDPLPAQQDENEVDYRVPQFQGKPRVRLMHKQVCGTCKSSIHDHHSVTASFYIISSKNAVFRRKALEKTIHLHCLITLIWVQ